MYFNDSLITVGLFYAKSVSMNGYCKEIIDEYVYDFVTLLIFYILVAFNHQWNFMIKRDKLCALQDDFSHLSIESSKKYLKAVKKARLYGILRLIQDLVTIVIVNLGYWIHLHEIVTSELKSIVTVTHIVSFLFWLFIAFSFLPGLFLCSQMTCNLMKSTEEIFLDGIKTKVILKNTLRLIKRTKRTSKLLSPIYFYQSLLAFFPLTFRIYQLIDFGFSRLPLHVLQYVGIVTHILGCGLTQLWILNTQSEDLKQQFKSIVMRKVLKKSITVFEFCSKILPILYLLIITSRINFDPMTKTMVMYGALVSVIWSL